MKTIDLKAGPLSAEELTALAENDPVRVRNAQGHEFLLAPADDFASEVELLRRNHDFLAFLDERFRSTKRKPLCEVEQRLAADGGEKDGGETP